MSKESKVVSYEFLEQQVQSMLSKVKELESGVVKGYDFNKGVNYEEIFKSYATTGFQATHLAQAIEIVNSMISWRLSDEPLNERDDEETSDPVYRANKRCTIYLGYTSNMVSCGMREIIRYLAQHKMIDCIVTTAGGIEEDLMKCMGTFHLGEFNMNDIENRLNGHCRIGNILVANDNYIKLESFLLPLFAKMAKEQVKEGIKWTPSKVIRRFGKEINNEESIYYWAYKNDIPVFCPAITDGGIGDVLFTNSYKNDLVIDVIEDIKELAKIAIRSPKTGAIIMGGGIPKHHILNSNIWKNGLDYAVYMNTGLYEDGSDSGAKASEGYTWAKLRIDAKYAKIFTEATLVFPILVAETFAKREKEAKKV